MTKQPVRMPTLETLQQWLRDDHDGFAARFHRARRIGCAKTGREIFEIADDALAILMTRNAPDCKHLTRALLRIEELCLSLIELVPGIDDVDRAERPVGIH